MNNMDDDSLSNDIAIVGMAGRFPKADNINTFWQNIINGVECITKEDSTEQNRIKAAGVLDNIEYFDAAYFGYSPREADIMDPQQRLMLECAVMALEDAGYTSDNYEGRIGVYLGSAISTYLMFNLLSRQDVLDAIGTIQISNGNDAIATSISYKLNLKGPSLDISTTCSSSLVAVHHACRSLLSYETDMALAGGSSINVWQDEGYIYQEGSILSSDGHCRPFDHRATGTVEGSGLGLVALKRLEDALEDHDHIYAVIKGSAINNDGSDKVGYTAPSVSGQAKVIAEALALANVQANQISYVETHGTGTVLGDPIEISALTQGFNLSSPHQASCAIGSVKANIGHLNTAAGIAGLIKTALALQHRSLPPSINYERANPQIDFATTPFFVNTQKRPWVSTSRLSAGVSSFGMGGTNAHVILQEAPSKSSITKRQQFYILPLSAKNTSALNVMKIKLAEHLQTNPEMPLADIAYTLQVGRQAHAHRSVVLVETQSDAIEALLGQHNKFMWEKVMQTPEPPMVFMFPGQGTQYVSMAHGIYQTEQVFKDHVDFCSDFLKTYIEIDLRDVIFATNVVNSQAINQTKVAQPALFVIGYALAKLLQSKGISPAAMIGHSVGEYVAACLAGVFGLQDALKIIALRGKLIQALPMGKMLAVQLSPSELQTFDLSGCDVAAINAEKQCVISGPADAISKLNDRLRQQNIETKLLHTSHAFHSSMLDPMLESFAACFQDISLNKPNLPFISNATGEWITDEQATNPTYWVNHVRGTVKFWDGVITIKQTLPSCVLLEVGPGKTLSQFAGKNNPTIQILPHPKETLSSKKTFLEAIAKLWLHGVNVTWPALYSEKPYRVSLPSYAFQRTFHWIERRVAEPANVIKNPLEKWLYVPTWKKNTLAYVENDTCAKAFTVYAVETSDKAFYEVLHLFQNLTSSSSRIIITTQNACKINGTENINPYHTMIQGLIRSFVQENPHIKCTQVDFDAATMANEDKARVIQNEFNHDLPDLLVAIRHKTRWVPHFDPIVLKPTTQSLLKDQGVYIITGGLGNLGLIIAKGLAKQFNTKLILVSRSKVTPALLQPLEEVGAEFLVISADVSDPHQLQNVFKEAKQRFTQVNGIIHAAGAMDADNFTTIDHLSPELCNQQFNPKINGVKAIQTLLDQQQFDFCCFFSSISSQLGGLGHGAYSAANLYMDGFVQLHNGNYQGTPLISLNWDAWYHGKEVLDDFTVKHLNKHELAINSEEGVKAFFNVLNSNHEQIIISTTSLNERIEKNLIQQSTDFKTGATTLHDRPNLSVPFVAPRDDLELQIAKLMTTLLGIQHIGIHDSFFELGGHSLLATQLASSIRDEFNIHFSIKNLFEAPTIAGIANDVLTKKIENLDAAKLETLLAEVE